MKKLSTRIISILIVLVMMFSLVGCGSCSSSKEVPEIDDIKRAEFTNGVHKYDYTETDKSIVKDRTSEYKVVIDDKASTRVLLAADDFIELFSEATGVDLEIIKDTEAVWSNDAKYFVIGDNATTQAAGISVDGLGLKWSGFIIKTVGNSIFMIGERDYGTNFAVYGYLELEFNYDVFNQYIYNLDKKDSVMLKNFDVVDIPDIMLRSSGNAWIYSNPKLNRRMRYTDKSDFYIDAYGGVHSAISYYLPLEKYDNPDDPENYHPDWYTADRFHLCYTANGNAEELEAMKQTVLEKMKEEIKKKDKNSGLALVFSQEDRYVWCKCDTCLEYERKYNSNAAQVIHMMNDLYDRIEAWMETEEGKPYKRDFQISFLAYDFTLKPPVNEIVDEKTGEVTYVPVDESVVCRENVVPIFAPIQMDYQQSIYSEANKSFYDSFEGWRAISSYWNIHTYQTNFTTALIPHDTFNQMEEFYIFAASANTTHFFDEGRSWDFNAATGWSELKGYLSAKLSWDVNSGIDNHIDKYFDNCYGKGSDEMRQWFNEYKAHSSWMIENLVGGDASVFDSYLLQKYWSREMLLRWLGYADSAMKEIEYLKDTDNYLYEAYKTNIELEKVSLYYLLVQLYRTQLSTELVDFMKKDCARICRQNGIIYDCSQSKPLEEVLFKEWGV